ncbi:MAG: alkanesulfonate monooxygenase, partial [Frankiales bacterium]|nr:alkanesulfonate monooxygenase [Frankiales bacterium]
MSLHLHWYLPTSGDGRGIVSAGRTGSRGLGDDHDVVERGPDIAYLAQIA